MRVTRFCSQTGCTPTIDFVSSMYLRGSAISPIVLVMLLPGELKQGHLHVRIVHEPGIGNASITLFEMVKRTELPFQLLGKPQIVVV